MVAKERHGALRVMRADHTLLKIAVLVVAGVIFTTLFCKENQRRERQ